MTRLDSNKRTNSVGDISGQLNSTGPVINKRRSFVANATDVIPEPSAKAQQTAMRPQIEQPVYVVPPPKTEVRRAPTEKKQGFLKRIFTFKKRADESNKTSAPPLPTDNSSESDVERRQKRSSSRFSITSFSLTRSPSSVSVTSARKNEASHRFNPKPTTPTAAVAAAAAASSSAAARRRQP